MDQLSQLKTKIKKIKSIPTKDFIDNKDYYINDLKSFLDSLDIDINEPIKTNSIVCRYTPLLAEFLQLNKRELIYLVYDKYINELNESVITENGDFKYDVISSLYLYCENEYLNTDYLVPLIFHFESLSLLEEIRSTKKKISILKYLKGLDRFKSASETFKKEIENRLINENEYNIKLILSSLSLNINTSINDLNSIDDNFITPDIKELKDKILQFKDEIKSRTE